MGMGMDYRLFLAEQTRQVSSRPTRSTSIYELRVGSWGRCRRPSKLPARPVLSVVVRPVSLAWLLDWLLHRPGDTLLHDVRFIVA